MNSTLVRMVSRTLYMVEDDKRTIKHAVMQKLLLHTHISYTTDNNILTCALVHVGKCCDAYTEMAYPRT